MSSTGSACKSGTWYTSALIGHDGVGATHQRTSLRIIRLRPGSKANTCISSGRTERSLRRRSFEGYMRTRTPRSRRLAGSLVLYSVLYFKAMAVATLSAKNQIVIPREARKALGLKPGDKVLVVVKSGTVFLLPEPKSYNGAIRGLARGTYPTTYLQKERQSWD